MKFHTSYIRVYRSCTVARVNDWRVVEVWIGLVCHANVSEQLSVSGTLLENCLTVECRHCRLENIEGTRRRRKSTFCPEARMAIFSLCENGLGLRTEVHKRMLLLPQVEFANPQVQVPLTGARRQIQFPRPFGARGGAQRGPNAPPGPETYQHYHR